MTINICVKCGCEFESSRGSIKLYCTHCSNIMNHERNAAQSEPVESPTTIRLRNGVEVLNNVFGKEIASARI